MSPEQNKPAATRASGNKSKSSGNKSKSSNNKLTAPVPILDTLQYLPEQAPANNFSAQQQQDFNIAKNYLLQYAGSRTTFEAYRRELERIMQWSWRINKCSILEINRDDMEAYLKFCNKPPKSWIGKKRVQRFRQHQGLRVANPEWRLFVISTKKSLPQAAINEPAEYSCSPQMMSSIFIALSSFYNYLLQENKVKTNPVALIRQKSKYIRRKQSTRQVRRLSELQWDFVIETAQILAQENPLKHERTLFVMSILYLLYLRISELVAKPRWQPSMGHFYRDQQENWWFRTVGKGNKERDVTVSKPMLKALIRYRQSRSLYPQLPTAGEASPLVTKQNSEAAICSERMIRIIVQQCFDRAIVRLQADGFNEDAQNLSQATVHWLRHTGISDDINRYGRPLAHVRDDAGHSSSATTDRYNDASLQERHHSGQRKQIRPDPE